MTGTPHPIAVPVHAVKAHFHAVNAQLHDWFDTLDDISIDVGKYHISLATALWMVTVVLFALISARVAGSVARRLLRRIKGLDSAQTSLGDKMITLAVWTFAFFATIDTLGISLTAFTVFSGAFGLAIGFGLQTTAGNLIAGIILLLDRSIKPGDVVAVTSGSTTTMGVVNKIGIRAISVTTLDNREYLIPNQNLMTSQVLFVAPGGCVDPDQCRLWQRYRHGRSAAARSGGGRAARAGRSAAQRGTGHAGAQRDRLVDQLLDQRSRKRHRRDSLGGAEKHLALVPRTRCGNPLPATGCALARFRRNQAIGARVVATTG